MTKQILFTLALAGCLAITCDAELIDVQFGCSAGSACNFHTNTTQFSGAAASGSSGDQWNLVTGDSNLGNKATTPVALKTVSGATTSVTVTWDSALSSLQPANSNITTGTYANLFNAYLIMNDSNQTTCACTIDIGGLVANKYYLLYMINQHGKGATGDEIRYTINGTQYAATNAEVTPVSSPGLTQDTNWEVYTVQATSGGDINLSFNKNSIAGVNAAINGFQLVETPEPGTVAMAGGGLLLVGIGRIRRRRQP